MLKEKIEWIFFDVGSTLFDESEAHRQRFIKSAANAGISYDEFCTAMIKFYKNRQKGDKEAAKLYGLKLQAWNSDDEIVYPDTEYCLKTLSKKFKIGVIANQIPGTEKRLSKRGLMKYISLVVASAEENIEKPDLRIFRLALKRAECKPQNAVMVGDRLDNDIAPANKIGMTTIWIKQGFWKYMSVSSDIEKADYEVENLSEVCQLLYE